MPSSDLSNQAGWGERLAALRNVPPVLRLVWDAAPRVVASGLALRVASALIPLAVLGVSRWIINLVVAQVKHPGPLPNEIWILLAVEFLLAALNNLLGRAIDYTDARLADEFTREAIDRLDRFFYQALGAGNLFLETLVVEARCLFRHQ